MWETVFYLGLMVVALGNAAFIVAALQESKFWVFVMSGAMVITIGVFLMGGGPLLGLGFAAGLVFTANYPKRGFPPLAVGLVGLGLMVGAASQGGIPEGLDLTGFGAEVVEPAPEPEPVIPLPPPPPKTNAPPKASDIEVKVAYPGVPEVFQVEVDDPDGPGPYVVEILSQPKCGVAQLGAKPRSIVYNCTEKSLKTDQLTFRVSDGALWSEAATAKVVCAKCGLQ